MVGVIAAAHDARMREVFVNRIDAATIAILVLATTTGCSSFDGAATGDGSACLGDCADPGNGSSGSSGAGSSGNGSSGSSGGCTPTPENSCSSSSGNYGPTAKNGVKDGKETDVDCGGPDAPKCADGKTCAADSDCAGACNYAKKCVSAPSCKPHLGGDTCGEGEVGQPGVQHESCCKSLPVPGFTDPSHPGKTVYLDKYEITAGRVRSWIEQLAAANQGKPDVKGWVAAHRPQIWDPAWDQFLPSDFEGGTVTIARRLLGDPRPEDNGDNGPPGPGVVLPPTEDQAKHMGVNYQFGPEVYVDLHGMDCGEWSGSYGFATYWYPDDVQGRNTQMPRAAGITFDGSPISAKDLLDVKSMNCITNAMLAAFCAWDGGQLATDEVLDFVTATPASLGNVSGCGVQYDNHGELLGNNFSHTVQTGGRCADVDVINATFDAGDHLPVDGSPLNVHNYHYPDIGAVTHDKSWQISAPGRASSSPEAASKAVDLIKIAPNTEGWMDLAGNLSEAAFDTTNGTFGGTFALKYRGIGYGSARSDLNMTKMKGETILRVQRPEAKAAYTGGRCMRFK